MMNFVTVYHLQIYKKSWGREILLCMPDYSSYFLLPIHLHMRPTIQFRSIRKRNHQINRPDGNARGLWRLLHLH